LLKDRVISASIPHHVKDKRSGVNYGTILCEFNIVTSSSK